MDIKLYYREHGEGEPLILLHGNGESSSYFDNQLEYFGKKYRVIALDTRGHGKSERGVAPFSLKQFADDLNGFMTEMEIDKAIILGFSDGANIAMEFALKYPEKVKKLILNGGNIKPFGVKLRYQLPTVLEYYKLKVFGAKKDRVKGYIELLGLMVKEPRISRAELSKITVPTLVIVGKDDMISEGHTRKIARSIPLAKLSVIDGDHFVAARNPDAFNLAVEEFLSAI